jgi:hypothetical protein
MQTRAGNFSSDVKQHSYKDTKPFAAGLIAWPSLYAQRAVATPYAALYARRTQRTRMRHVWRLLLRAGR